MVTLDTEATYEFRMTSEDAGPDFRHRWLADMLVDLNKVGAELVTSEHSDALTRIVIRCSVRQLYALGHGPVTAAVGLTPSFGQDPRALIARLEELYAQWLAESTPAPSFSAASSGSQV